MYGAIVVREIYWKGRPYRAGEKIELDKDQMVSLQNAGAIGNVIAVENMTITPPENQKLSQAGRPRKID